jgi:hypothetical protein
LEGSLAAYCTTKARSGLRECQLASASEDYHITFNAS